MPLHLTKIAYGCPSLAYLEERLAARGAEAVLTTRNRPRRDSELVGGSIYWIIAHKIVARSPIIRLDTLEDKRTGIIIEPRTILVETRPRRAHQGWRYLEDADAPPDFASLTGEGDPMPPELRDELMALGLV